jgi:iron complex outermembrane receptor protein
MFRRFLVAGMTAATLASTPGHTQALAQGGPASAASDPQDQSVSQLQEITVTARRRSEDLEKVPIAITVFDQRALDENRIESTADLQYYVPSFNVSGQFNRDQEFFTIRGQGETGLNVSSAPGGGPAVVAYFAEVPLVVGGGTEYYYDLSNVQVLKGPQGTLFGRNTTGGAILFEPKRPTNDVEGYGQVTVGDYQDLEFEGAVNLPIVRDTLLARVAFQQIGREGYTKDVGPLFFGRRYNNRDDWSVRLSVLWTPGDALENYFVATASQSRDHGPGTEVLGVNPASLAAQTFPELAGDAAAQQARGPRLTALSTFEGDLLKTYAFIDHTTVRLTDNTRVKNIMSYSRRLLADASDRDGMPAPLLDAIGPAPGRWHDNWQVLTEELQFQGNAFDRLQWQAGGYLEDQLDFDANFNQVEFFNLFNNYLARADIQQKSRALYGQATYSITSALKLTAGYRYTWDSLTTTLGLGTGFGTPAAAFLGGSAPHSGYSSTLGLDYQVSPGVLLYLTSRRGYKSGGFNLLSQGPSSPFFSYRPEDNIDVESGVKASGPVAGMPARLNADAFYTWYNNAQVAAAEVIDGQAASVTTNAAKAKIKGVELEGSLLPGAGFEFTLAYSYNDGRYTTYFSPVSGDLSGTPIGLMPKHKVNLGVRYTLPLDASLGSMSASANYSAQSRYFAAQSLGDPFGYVPAYSLLNLRLDWDRVMSSRFDAGIFVTNLANKTYEATVIPLYTSVFGYSAASFGPPRMFGVTLRYDF